MFLQVVATRLGYTLTEQLVRKQHIIDSAKKI